MFAPIARALPVPKRLRAKLAVALLASSAAALSVSGVAHAADPFVARHGMSSGEYQQAFDSITKQGGIFGSAPTGFRLTDVSGYSQGNAARYAAIWTKTPGTAGWQARHDMSASQLQGAIDTLRPQGYRPMEVEGFRVGNGVRFAAIFDQTSNPPWSTRFGMTAAQYQQEFNALAGQGFRLTHLSVYDQAGTARFATTWAKDGGLPQTVRHGLTSAGLQSTANALAAQGLRPTEIEGYQVGSQLRFAGIWERNTIPTQAFWGLTSDAYQAKFNSLTAQGLHPVKVSGYAVNGVPRYAAVFQRT